MENDFQKVDYCKFNESVVNDNWISIDDFSNVNSTNNTHTNNTSKTLKKTTIF